MYKIHSNLVVCSFYSLYLKEGFLHLQNLVAMSIIEQIVGDLSPMYNFTEIPVNVKVGWFGCGLPQDSVTLHVHLTAAAISLSSL